MAEKVSLACFKPIVITKQNAPWTVRTPGNSVGVAISQPRVEGRSTSTLGNNPLNDSNSVGVAISRRRYRSRKISRPMANATTPNII